MKRVFVVLLFFSSFNFDLCAKSLMMGLDKIKQKVEKAVKDPSSMNFRDYCNQKLSKNKGFVDGSQAKCDGQSFYWCNQENLVKSLEASLNQKDQAMAMLKNEIHKKYEKENSPFLCFARDLLKEESDIQSMMNDVKIGVFNRLTQQKDILLRLINIVENLLAS